MNELTQQEKQWKYNTEYEEVVENLGDTVLIEGTLYTRTDNWYLWNGQRPEFYQIPHTPFIALLCYDGSTYSLTLGRTRHDWDWKHLLRFDNSERKKIDSRMSSICDIILRDWYGVAKKIADSTNAEDYYVAPFFKYIKFQYQPDAESFLQQRVDRLISTLKTPKWLYWKTVTQKSKYDNKIEVKILFH